MTEDLDFHHIGIATGDLEKSIELYEFMGYVTKGSRGIVDPIQRVKLAFMFKKNHPLIELVSPLDEESPVKTILNKMRTTPYHTCYETSDLEVTIKDFKKQRFVLVQKPTPAIAFNNKKIAFLYHKYIGLIELLEK
tara:strand:+ start:1072 stop:1479 length:408 start_codon:yes stop_codon:yes gene_type:complete